MLSDLANWLANWQRTSSLEDRLEVALVMWGTFFVIAGVGFTCLWVFNPYRKWKAEQTANAKRLHDWVTEHSDRKG